MGSVKTLRFSEEDAEKAIIDRTGTSSDDLRERWSLCRLLTGMSSEWVVVVVCDDDDDDVARRNGLLLLYPHPIRFFLCFIAPGARKRVHSAEKFSHSSAHSDFSGI